MIRITIRDKPRNRCAKLTPLRLAILRGIADGTPPSEVRKAQRLRGSRHFSRSRNDLVDGGYIVRDYSEDPPFKLTESGRAALEAAE